MLRSLRSRRPGLVRVGALTAAVLAVTLTVQQGSTASPSDIHGPRGSKAITPAKGTVVRKTFFGMHASSLSDALPESQVGAVNFTTNGVYWPQLEKSPGQFDFTRLDGLVDEAAAHGARPLLVLGQTPSFHSTTPDSAPVVATVPDMAAWKTYVTSVAERYGTRLEYQVWPEPNVTNNWNGTTQQLADLIVAAAKILHRVAPGSTVVAPPMVLRLRYQRQYMKTLFASKVNGVPLGRYVDAVTIDPYPLQTGTPETAMSLTTAAQRILAANRVTAPLWVAEINYGVPVGGGGTALQYTERIQAAYVARTFLLNAALGVQRVYWLGWFVYPTLGVNMVEPDRVTMKAAGHALVLARSWLLGQHARGCFHAADRDLYSCAFVRDGRTSWAYWTGSGAAHVTAPAGARKVVKATGESAPTIQGQRIRVTPVPVWVTH
jgi:hypothetical protein